jgi:hypothetical protein
MCVRSRFDNVVEEAAERFVPCLLASLATAVATVGTEVRSIEVASAMTNSLAEGFIRCLFSFAADYGLKAKTTALRHVGSLS